MWSFDSFLCLFLTSFFSFLNGTDRRLSNASKVDGPTTAPTLLDVAEQDTINGSTATVARSLFADTGPGGDVLAQPLDGLGLQPSQHLNDVFVGGSNGSTRPGKI